MHCGRPLLPTTKRSLVERGAGRIFVAVPTRSLGAMALANLPTAHLHLTSTS